MSLLLVLQSSVRSERLQTRSRCDSVTASCWAPGLWPGSTGEMIPAGRTLCLPSGSNTFQVFSWSGYNTRELCCVWRSRRLYSQADCSLYCTLTARSASVTCFCHLPLPFTHLLQTRLLPHSRKEPRHSYINRQAYFSRLSSNVAGPYGDAMTHQTNQSVSMKPQHGRQCR